MRPVMISLATFTLILIFFSCGSYDDRNQIRSRNGEPDEVQTLGRDPFWRELWFYDSAGIGYEFRRTAGCGSSRDVYLYTTFAFIPDTSGAGRILPENVQALPETEVLERPSQWMTAPQP